MQKVTIVGRPNVGKSTLFNRLLGSRSAITAFEEGTTRDTVEKVCDFGNFKVNLADTAGLIDKTNDEIGKEVAKKLKDIYSQTDIFIFIVNGREPAGLKEVTMAEEILKYNKPIILVLNKIDSQETHVDKCWDNWLIKKPIALSSVNGTNTNELADRLSALIRQKKNTHTISKNIIIIGRPNVGKSSLINALTQSDRMIATPIPGTTRDVVSINYNHQDIVLNVLDTPGIRRRGKIEVGAEKFGLEHTKRELMHASLAVIVLDSQEGATRQDIHVVQMAENLHIPIIIVFNKLDLTENYIPNRFHYLSKFPQLFVSAKTGDGIEKLRDEIVKFT